MAEKYDFKEIEQQIYSFWDDKKVVDKLRTKNKKQKKFYFLQGPPYTSGRLHMGHAWNNTLKDVILRYKRMHSFNVWDRSGYDMHGLPTELKVMKDLGMKYKEEILEYGLGKFNKKCEHFSVEMMKLMDIDLQKLGVTMDFSDSYQPIKKEFIEGEWALIKKADETQRLYKGERTLSWCSDCASALAKHEQEYKTITDESIFVKMQVLNKEEKKETKTKKDSEFFVIWTTTPWTIPFNLAIMVNPDLDYQKCLIKTGPYKGESWIVAKQLAGVFIKGVANAEYDVLEEFKGESLEGKKYIHPFSDQGIYKDIIAEKLHSVLLSTEYVDTSAGTGLVHCAPGCGPEDYEVGYRNGLPPFNSVDEKGVFPEQMKEFAGLKAKDDDSKFVEALRNRNALIASNEVEHEYAHCWRHGTPVIFRTTEQWFLKTEDLKETIIQKNKNVNWVPKIASSQFESWINNIRDNSITKQRFWGTPAPIWVNVDDEKDYIVIGSVKELEKLSGQKVTDVHKPFIDEIIIKKQGKTYKRILDVLDVWLDSGTVSWNCLYNDPELIKQFYPADFIVEGKEQIRLWYYMLAICSELMGYKEFPFKNVYCHGMLNAVDGVKMSKSLGNIISPYEISDKYGFDTLRYYLSSITAAQNISFSWDDIQQKYRNINVLWNVHNYVLDYFKNENFDVKIFNEKHEFETEDLYMLSLLNVYNKKITLLLEGYELDKAVNAIEELFLKLSRDYIKMIREKTVTGTTKQKKAVAYVLLKSILDITKMFSIYAPYTCEKMYQNFKPLGLTKESISHESWVEIQEKYVDETLIQEFEIALTINTSILGAREKAGIGVRWPLPEAFVLSEKIKDLTPSILDVIKNQTNVKKISFKQDFAYEIDFKVKTKKVAELFKKETATILENIEREKAKIILAIKNKEKIIIDKKELSLDLFDITKNVEKPFYMAESNIGITILNAESNKELDLEGYAREITRRIQDLRKQNDFTKDERIELQIFSSPELIKGLEKHLSELNLKVGSKKTSLKVYNETLNTKYNQEFKIKNEKIKIGFDKL